MAPPLSADPMKITSIDAKPLINGLRLAAVKSTKKETKTTWTIKTLSCATTKGDEITGFDTATCQTDGKKITGAAAVVLMKGMQDSKIPQPYRMSGELIEANGVTCAWETDISKGGSDGPFVCSYTAGH
ncbi:hypothetical protein BH11MYX2_BH11MYX2_21350 [soil metagenome]